MANKPPKKPAGTTVTLDPNPKGELKALGGSNDDKWNLRLANLVVEACAAKTDESTTAMCRAMVSLAPADPVEGIIIAQLLAANEASLSMYRLAWAQPPEYFQARTKYMQLADKASRTALMLTERLDHHRGRGQQQIVVKHVTVNADQAMVAETITTVPALQSRAQPILDQIIQPELVDGGCRETT